MRKRNHYYNNIVTNCTRCKTEIEASESLPNTGYCNDCAVLVAEIQEEIKEESNDGKTTTNREK